MRRSAGSYQRSGVLKPRNSNVTPNSRSGHSARKSYLPKPSGGDSVSRAGVGAKSMRKDSGTRLSLASSGRITPIRNMQTLNPTASSSVSRMSMESNRSSFGGKTRKEVRPITDSAFKSHCIDKVIWFLQGRSYEYEVTRRILLHPTTKDFTNIFQFIYCHLEHGYTLPSKFEEEIPRVLKCLKYPTQMTKASFITVGSPHTWPAVLAMLAWLVDVVCVFENSDPFAVAFPDDFEGAVNLTRVRFDAYVKYFNGGSDSDEPIENFKEKLENNSNLLPFDDLQEELKLLDDDIATYRDSPENVKELHHQRMKIEQDKNKMVLFCQEMQKCIAVQDSERCRLEKQVNEGKYDLTQICGKVSHMEQLKAEQNLSPSKIHYIKNHVSKVSKQLLQLEEEEKELDSQVWNVEVGISKSQEKFGALARQINALCRQMDLGSEFTVNTASIEEMMEQWEKKLIPELKTMKKNCKQRNCNSQMRKINEEKELYMMQEMLKEDCNQRTKLESKLARLEEELQMSREEITQKETKMNEELEKLRCQILEARRGLNGSLYQKQCELEETLKRCEEQRNHDRQKIKTSVKYFIQVCHALVDDIKGQQEEIDAFLKKITIPFEELEEATRKG